MTTIFEDGNVPPEAFEIISVMALCQCWIYAGQWERAAKMMRAQESKLRELARAETLNGMNGLLEPDDNN